MRLKTILVSGIWVSGGIMLGRITGFAREALVAASFGVTVDTDIAVLSLTVPDFLVNLLIAGGLSAALIPEFKSHGEQRAGHLFVQSSLFALLVVSLLTTVLVFTSDTLIALLAPGLEAGGAAKASLILRNVLWVIPVTVLTGVSTAFLHSLNRFGTPSMGTFIFNASVVAGLFFFVRDTKGLSVLVVFIFIGGGLRWISQLIALRRDVHFRGVLDRFLLTKDIFHRYWQAVVAAGVLTFYPVVVRSISSLEGDGNLSVMNFSIRLLELPLGVVITVLSVVLYPRLSACFAKNVKEQFSQTLHEGIIWSVLMAVAIMGAMIFVSGEIVELVYDWGSIEEKDLAKIALVTMIGVISLPFQAFIAMTTIAFNAQKNTKVPMVINVIGLVLLVIFCRLAQQVFHLQGVMIGFVVIYLLLAGFHAVILHRKEGFGLNLTKLFLDLTLPCITVLSITGFGIYLGGYAGCRGILLVIVAGILALLALAMVAIMVPRYRLMVMSWAQKRLVRN